MIGMPTGCLLYIGRLLIDIGKYSHVFALVEHFNWEARLLNWARITEYDSKKTYFIDFPYVKEAFLWI